MTTLEFVKYCIETELLSIKMMYGTEWDEKRYLQTFISFGDIYRHLSLLEIFLDVYLLSRVSQFD